MKNSLPINTDKNGRDNSGRFTHGNNGKSKGSINKTTKEIRETISRIVSNNIDAIQNDLDELSPRDRLKVLVDLIQYITPKLKAVGYQEITEHPKGPDLSVFTTEELRKYLDKLCD
jgi:hypothetical protein